MLGPGGGNDFEKPHGYVFEVPADGTSEAEPLRAMGRFVHEAIAVDPDTGIVYETEDQQTAGFYRFLPTEPGNLPAGGRLEMLAVAGAPEADLRAGQATGDWRRVEWVPIDDPDPADAGPNTVFAQGREAGGATFRRLEGIWYGGGRIYVVSTEGGDVRMGQVWEYEPAASGCACCSSRPGATSSTCRTTSASAPAGASCSARTAGTATSCAACGPTAGFFPSPATTSSSTAGRTASPATSAPASSRVPRSVPDGRWLFVNVQIPGVTIAITGPWADGAL